MSKAPYAAIQAGLVSILIAVPCQALVSNSNARITVLDSETRSVILDNSGVPKNCDAVNFDAYCHNSQTVRVTNTLLVQEGNQAPFRVSCTADTVWSQCRALPRGQTFEAKREKHGLVVYFLDDRGRLRKQLYSLTSPEDSKAANVSATALRAQGPSAEQQGQAPSAASGGQSREVVQCSFSSTPSGAELTVDGRFVGSTPSVLSLSVGDHAVEVSLPGFAPWKRDLTVSAGSLPNVNALLQKVQ